MQFGFDTTVPHVLDKEFNRGDEETQAAYADPIEFDRAEIFPVHERLPAKNQEQGYEASVSLLVSSF